MEKTGINIRSSKYVSYIFFLVSILTTFPTFAASFTSASADVTVPGIEPSHDSDSEWDPLSARATAVVGQGGPIIINPPPGLAAAAAIHGHNAAHASTPASGPSNLAYAHASSTWADDVVISSPGLEGTLGWWDVGVTLNGYGEHGNNSSDRYTMSFEMDRSGGGRVFNDAIHVSRVNENLSVTSGLGLIDGEYRGQIDFIYGVPFEIGANLIVSTQGDAGAYYDNSAAFTYSVLPEGATLTSLSGMTYPVEYVSIPLIPEAPVWIMMLTGMLGILAKVKGLRLQTKNKSNERL